MPTDLKLKESNWELYAMCGYCGKMHIVERAGREKGTTEQVDLPAKCSRCSAPLNWKGAQAFGERMAEAAHDPALALTGARLRGMPGPPADKMVIGAENK